MALQICLYATLILPLITAQTPSNKTYTLHHRFLSTPPSPFLPYGEISITPPPFPTASFGFIDHEMKEGVVDDGKGWYQVGLKFDEDGEEDRWLMASTKSCHLVQPGITYLTLLVVSHRPSGIEVKQSGTAKNGDCPIGSVGSSSIHLPTKGDGSRVEVRVMVPERVQSPVLAPPPPVDETTGAPVVPPVEKSFLQKYWLPILGIGLFLAAQMGPDQARGGAGAAGSQGNSGR